MLITPVGILITVALLAMYAAYSLWMAVVWHSPLSGVAGVLAIVACVGAAMLKPWSRYIVYLLTASAVATWVWSLYDAARAGYFGYFSARQIARSLAPGAFLILLSCFCAYAVFRQFRTRTPQAPGGSQSHADEGNHVG